MKRIINDKEVFVRFNSNNLTGVNCDLDFTSATWAVGENRYWRLNFHTNQDIYSLWGIGDNKTIPRKNSNTNSVSKDANNNSDNNGVLPPIALSRNFIKLSNPLAVEKLTITDSVNSCNTIDGTPNIKLPNLKQFIFTNNINIKSSNIVSFEKIQAPLLEKLDIRVQQEGVMFPTISVFPNLKWCRLIGRDINYSTLMSNISSDLEYLSIHLNTRSVVDIGNFFNGTRKALEIVPPYSSIDQGYIYNGDAVFPSVITDSEDFPIDYIFQLRTYIDSIKLTPDMVSKLLIDFANQVTSVTTTLKRIRLQAMPANTSYEDLSQPLFTTYASALTHITSTLGITVQFT